MHQLNDNYKPVVLPVDYNRSFLDFSNEELREYYLWFLKIKDDRLDAFCDFLFSEKDSCLSERNINVIEVLLQNSISVYPKPDKQISFEREQIPSHLKGFAKPDEYLFDKRTISLCFDIGIFLGDLIVSLDKKVKWNQETDINFADFGQPILQKKGCLLKINPFRVSKNIAARIHEGSYINGQLALAFSTWKKGFKVP